MSELGQLLDSTANLQLLNRQTCVEYCKVKSRSLIAADLCGKLYVVSRSLMAADLRGILYSCVLKSDSDRSAWNTVQSGLEV